MKKTFAILLTFILSISCFSFNAFADTVKITADEEMRAAWLATVYSLDLLEDKDNPNSQRHEYIEKLDQLQQIGINTVVVQVRPKADALYNSKINPWSEFLTGVQGKSPDYDPLAFMIYEAHQRGMEFHAWLNPYRVTTQGSTNVNNLSKNHPARLHPNWVLEYNDALYYNPELRQVKQHIVDTVVEIVENYDVDAIHFDDYFYPANYPLPNGEDRDGATANERREHINEMIRLVSKAIKDTKPDVEFGVSPMGIWKNSSSDSTGSATSGTESYYYNCADSRTWIKNGWIDYIVPQLYWEIGSKKTDYETLVDWWSNEVAGTDVKLYIGQGIYRDAVAKQIDKQLAINSRYNVSGSFYYSARFLLDNIQGCKYVLTSIYNSNDSSYRLGTVTADVLNIRYGSSTAYGILGRLKLGTLVKITEQKGDWYKIELPDNMSGWVHSDYIKLK